MKYKVVLKLHRLNGEQDGIDREYFYIYDHKSLNSPYPLIWTKDYVSYINGPPPNEYLFDSPDDIMFYLIFRSEHLNEIGQGIQIVSIQKVYCI